MTECQHCLGEHDLTFVLDDVHMRGGLVSSIKSRYVVCAQCKTDLEDDEDVTW